MKAIFKNIVVAALIWESQMILAKYKPKIVAVTGSVGKTSTKDAIFTVMSHFFHVRKSEKSFNSDIGIPLTIIGCANAWSDPVLWLKNILQGLFLIVFPHHYPEWLVLEVGADRPGDIQNITRWLKPDVAVVTAFAKVPVHVEFFAGREAVIREKQYLVEALKHDGILVANGDDDDVMRMKDASKNKAIVYGTDAVADLVGSDSQIHYGPNKEIDGMTFKVQSENNIVPIVIRGSLGMQNMYSALAALAVGLSQKVNLVKAAEAFLDHETPRGRMRIIPGIKGSTVIDDTYNSSPIAVASALATLKNINTKGTKIAVLGDMLELGKHSVDEHYRAGKQAAETADILIAIGIRARKIAEGALDAGMPDGNIFEYDTAAEVKTELANMVKKHDIILVKGSQSMRMERIVEALMAAPEQAKDLLVRQDEEWKKK